MLDTSHDPETWEFSFRFCRLKKKNSFSKVKVTKISWHMHSSNKPKLWLSSTNIY